MPRRRDDDEGIEDDDVRPSRRKRRDEDDDEAERPSRRSRRDDEDDDDIRSSRRSRREDEDDEDEDDDDRPLRRRRKGKKKGRAKQLAKLQGPAIGLIVVVSIHLATICICLPFVLIGMVGQGAAMAQGHNDFSSNPVVNLVQIFIGFLIQGFQLFGAIQMKRGSMYVVCMIASVLAVIPCFCSSCYVLGIPFGIWAIMVLNEADVKESFDS